MGVYGAATPEVSTFSRRHERIGYGVTLGLGALATLSLFQGVVDIALPLSRGETPFGFTFGLMHKLGPGILFLSILVHNLGLAGLLPGLGFLAAMLEPNPRARRLIAPILLLALLLSMGTAVSAIFAGPGDFDLRFSLPLFLAEATAVLAVAFVSYGEFRRFLPRAPGRRDVARAFEAVAVPVFVSALGLIVLAVLETLVILGVQLF